MEVDTVEKGENSGLEYCDASMSFEQVQVPMAVQVLMNRAVPFACVFVEIGRVPEVLVKLPVRKAREHRVEVQAELKDDEEKGEEKGHDRQVPIEEGVGSMVYLDLIEETGERQDHLLGQLIGNKLQRKLLESMQMNLTSPIHMSANRQIKLRTHSLFLLTFIVA